MGKILPPLCTAGGFCELLHCWGVGVWSVFNYPGAGSGAQCRMLQRAWRDVRGRCRVGGCFSCPRRGGVHVQLLNCGHYLTIVVHRFLASSGHTPRDHIQGFNPELGEEVWVHNVALGRVSPRGSCSQCVVRSIPPSCLGQTRSLTSPQMLPRTCLEMLCYSMCSMQVIMLC